MARQDTAVGGQHLRHPRSFHRLSFSAADLSHDSAKYSLNGMTDDNFLPKTLMPKNGFIEGNVHFAELSFHFLPEQQRKKWVFSTISLLTP